jgi:hypothetical protein
MHRHSQSIYKYKFDVLYPLFKTIAMRVFHDLKSTRRSPSSANLRSESPSPSLGYKSAERRRPWNTLVVPQITIAPQGRRVVNELALAVGRMLVVSTILI